MERNEMWPWLLLTKYYQVPNNQLPYSYQEMILQCNYISSIYFFEIGLNIINNSVIL